MPLFGRKEEVVEPTPVVHEEPKRHGLFGSRRERSLSPTSTHRSSTTTNSHRTSTSFHTSPSNASSGRKSFLSRSFGHGNNVEMDPSIVQARERVLSAENAEREADRAMEAARLRVREAREHVKKLEIEAAEEAKRAKVKMYHAREVGKRGKQLGRKSEIPTLSLNVILIEDSGHDL